MNEKYKRLGKDIIIFALGTIGSKLILFLLVPLYTNILSSGEYGTADLVFTVGQLLIPCFSLCIYDAVLRFGLINSVSKGDVLYSSIVVFAIGAIITIISSPLLMLYSPIAPWIKYLVLYVISSTFNNIMLIYLKTKDFNKLYSVMSILQAFLLICFNITFLVLLKWGIRGYLLSTILASLITGVVAFILSSAYKDLRDAKLNKPLLIEMVKYSSPLILNSISWGIIHSSDKVMLEMMMGASALGIYTVSSKIPSLINVVSTIFNQAWGLSSIKEYDSSNDESLYSNVFSMFSTIMFAAFFAICFILKPFMSIYVGADYYGSWVFVPILLLSACFTAFSGFLGAIYSAVKKSINVTVTTIIAGVCNVIVNFCLIPRIGIWGATIGTLTAYVVITAVRMIDIHRYIPFRYNLEKFIPLTILSLVYAVLFSLDRTSLPVNLLMIILLALIDYKNYTKILKNAIFIVNKAFRKTKEK